MNKRFEGILLASDLDGTLITRDLQIPGNNIKAIEYFCKNGGKFAAATGRSPQSAKKALKNLAPNAPCICLNGAVIYDYSADKCLWECELCPEAKEYIADILNRFSKIGIEVFSENISYILRLNKRTEAHMIKEDGEYKICDISQADGKLYKVLFMGEPEDINELDRYCMGLNYSGVTFVASGDTFYEMLPQEANKGFSLKKLAKLLEIDIKNVYSVGDFYNDRQLISEAGFGACVEDAPSEIKDIADAVVCKCESGAVSQLINIIEEKQSI